jgi:hypothetical protein
MNNPWKLATIGLALAGVTAISTGLTTAYVLRPSTEPATLTEAAPAPAAASPTRIVRAPRAVPAQIVAQPAPVPVATPAVATRPAVVRPASVTPVATDCTTGGERAMKIAKPGLIGALAGAGLGAIGGAIADGGDAAGKGALIGGIAGAALGGGYGAYKTKQECGTIFGSSAGFAGSPIATVPQAAVGASNGISVFNAR